VYWQLVCCDYVTIAPDIRLQSATKSAPEPNCAWSFANLQQVSYDGADSGPGLEIDLDTPHKEFARWQWMPLEQLPERVVPFKRAVYEEVGL
jgi:hypothetical protein